MVVMIVIMQINESMLRDKTTEMVALQYKYDALVKQNELNKDKQSDERLEQMLVQLGAPDVDKTQPIWIRIRSYVMFLQTSMRERDDIILRQREQMSKMMETRETPTVDTSAVASELTRLKRENDILQKKLQAVLADNMVLEGQLKDHAGQDGGHNDIELGKTNQSMSRLTTYPFAAAETPMFKKLARNRQEMPATSAYDKVMLRGMRLCISTSRSRTFFFGYLCLLHALVLIVLYSYTSSPYNTDASPSGTPDTNVIKQ